MTASEAEYRQASKLRGMGEMEVTSFRGIAEGLGETGRMHATFQMKGMERDCEGMYTVKGPQAGWGRGKRRGCEECQTAKRLMGTVGRAGPGRMLA